MKKFFSIKGTIKVSGIDGLGNTFERNLSIEIPLPSKKTTEAKLLAKSIVENFGEKYQYIKLYCDQITKEDKILEEDFYFCSEERIK